MSKYNSALKTNDLLHVGAYTSLNMIVVLNCRNLIISLVFLWNFIR